METLFWVSLVIVAYVYAGYPLLVAGWARVVRRVPRRASANSPRDWPSISIVIAVHNEAHRLRARVGNLLRLAYPGRREIIVASDGSTDDPAAAIAAFGASVRLLELPRRGKPGALNAGVAAATGDIIVFADARQAFCPGALMELAANFDDPSVGGATGELVLDCELAESDSSVADGVGLYWKYEKWVRRNESLVWSTVGATGAIYALRRHLWRPLPLETLLDDVLTPMRAVLAGWRVVFCETAVALDHVAPDASTESRRKIRTLAGNYQILALEPRLLVPFVNPVWLQYLSHKVGRLLVPWALLAMFASNVVLAPTSTFHTVVLVLQLAFYALAAFGAWLENAGRAAELGDRHDSQDRTAGAGRVRVRDDELRRAGGAVRPAARPAGVEMTARRLGSAPSGGTGTR